MKKLIQNYKWILIFCMSLVLQNYTYGQVPVQQFWALNQSLVSNTFVWDNTGWNKQIDNGSGTFTLAAPVWTANNGKTDTKWVSCKNAIFGGNLGVGPAGTVTLSVPVTDFASITFNPAVSGDFTITAQSIQTNCASDLPIAVASGLSPTIASVLNGTNSITKTGNGTLILKGTNTYTGATNVNAGTFQIGAGATAGTIAAGSPVNVNTAATFFWNNPATMTFNNNLSGTGTVQFQGNSSSSNKRVSQFSIRGANTGFSGNMRVKTADLLFNSQSQLGTSTITVEQGACVLLQTVGFNNAITLEDKSGYWDSNPTINVAGALWFQGGASLSGNLILNNTTNVVMGDATALNSALLVWDGGNSTISGVISGPGHLSMSSNSGGWTNGTSTPPPPCNISLTGTLSNTYSGITVVNGQQRIASLLLMKTGGAVAIPANGTVWMGNNTGRNSLNQPGVGAESNLRMGDDQSTGGTQGPSRNQWDNQFGTNVLMQFNNTGINNTRFDLQGTNQSLAGLNAGTTSSVMAAVIQNQNLNGFNPKNPATLTLTGSGNYVYNGYMRDKESSGVNPADPNLLNLVWSGSGSQTLVGTLINYTGTTTVNSGSLICYNTTTYNSNTTVNSGGTLEMNVPSGTITGSYTIDGSGSLVKSGTGVQVLSGNNTYSGNTNISGGTLQCGDGTTNNGLSANTGNIVISPTGTLYLNYATAVNMSSSNYGPKITGSGVLRLNSAQPVNGTANWGANSSNIFGPGFTGTLQIDNGRIDCQISGLTGVKSIIVNQNAQFMARTGTYSQDFTLNGNGWGESGYPGSLRIAGSASAIFTGTVTLTGNTNLLIQDKYASMELQGSINTNGYSLGGVLGAGGGGGGNLILNTKNDLTVSGTFINQGSITLNSSSTITLTGNNTYSGGTIINTGMMVAGNVNAFGTGTIIINAGGTLKKNGFAITNTIINNGGTVLP